MADESCHMCGARYALVGRAHRCSGVIANKPEIVANVANTVANTDDQVANTEETYARYRDKDKRREYMRLYMARKRQRPEG